MYIHSQKRSAAQPAHSPVRFFFLLLLLPHLLRLFPPFRRSLFLVCSREEEKRRLQTRLREQSEELGCKNGGGKKAIKDFFS